VAYLVLFIASTSGKTHRFSGSSSHSSLASHYLTRDSLHTILKAMGRESADFHIFRRFRESILQMSEVRTLLIDYWMGHADGEMAGRYGKQLLDNVRWRQECAAKVGLGFTLPESAKRAVVGPLRLLSMSTSSAESSRISSPSLE
jgi:hypothetical protein